MFQTTVEVMDSTGKLLFSAKSKDSDLITLDISSLANGLYLIKVSSEHNIQTFKFVKQ
jgi:hypothetical protein